MEPATIQLLYEHLRWADERMLGAVSGIPSEEFVKDLGNSHKSIRDTLVHIASAEWIWLSRWKGTSPRTMWSPADHPTLDALRAAWAPVHEDLTAFVEAQTEATLARDVSYVNTQGKAFTYPLGPLMLHCSTHAAYHRGQVTTMIRQLGRTPISTDLSVFLGARFHKAI